MPADNKLELVVAFEVDKANTEHAPRVLVIASHLGYGPMRHPNR